MEISNQFIFLIAGLLFISFATALLSQILNPNKNSETFSGTLYEQPVTDGKYKSININNRRVYMSRYADLNQGDYINLDFKSCTYSEKFNSYDDCEIFTDKSKENYYLKQILSLRNTIINRAKMQLPSPHDVLILAMTIGYKDDLPDSLTEKLREIGAIHMLVVSGYNVSLILNSSGVLLMRFPRWIYVSSSIFLLCMFILLTGFDAPIMRSVIMGTFIVFSKATANPTASLYLLIMSAIIMVSWSPFYLSNISFQLSFLATFGVIISDHIFRSKNELLSDLGASIGASIFVLPILSFYFGIVSFLGIISSILLGWLVPLITYLGFIIYAVDIPPINFLLTLVIDLFLKISDLISYFSFLNIEYKFSEKDLILYYIFIGMLIMLIYKIKGNFTNENE